jgi:hypothetical protein
MSEGILNRLGQSRWMLRIVVLATVGLMVLRCLLGVFGGSEPYLNNDEPRQIMTAIFWYDFLRIRPLSDPVGFTYAYYGHYPAIVPLHWPPLAHLMGGLAFQLTGPSVEAARLLVLLMALGFLWATGAWVRQWAGPQASLFAVALLAGCPLFLEFAWVFMLEVPCLLWISLAVLSFGLYVRKGNALYVWLALGFALAALLTKQHGLTVVPLLLAGAVAGFSRRQWRSVHVWVAAAAAAGAGAAYYCLALGNITTSWQDVAVPSNSLGSCIAEFVLAIGPLLAGLGIAALAALAVFFRRSRAGWVGLIWAAGVVGFFLGMGAKEARYLIFLLPVAAAGGGFVLQAIFNRANSPVRLALLVGLLAVSGYQILRIPGARLSGYARAAKRAEELSSGSAVVFGGKFDGTFILYRRLGDQRLASVTLRTGKLLGSGVVMPRRNYREYVSSEEEFLDKLAAVGAGLIVTEQDAEMDRPAYRLFRKLLDGDRFQLVDEIPARYANGQVKAIRFHRYLGPVKAAADITLPMPSLAAGRIHANLGKPLLDWNRAGDAR